MNPLNLFILFFPVAIAIGMLPMEGLGTAMRVLMLLSIVGGFAAIPQRMTRTELRWMFLMILLLLSSTASAIMSENPSVSYLDVGRQAYVALLGIAFTFSCRKLAARRLFAFGTGLAALFSCSFIVYAWLMVGRTMGSEAMKSWSADRSIELNPIAGMAVMALLIFSLRMPSRSLFITMQIMNVLIAYLSGARTTLIALLMAIAVVQGVKKYGFARVKLIVAYTGGLIAMGVIAYLTLLPHYKPLPDQLAKVTTGRSYLWKIAIDRFSERPIFGWGPETWLDDLPQSVANVPPRWRDGLLKLTAGGYHSAYLTYLAERGIIGATVGISIIWFFVSKSWFVFEAKNRLVGFDRRLAGVAPLMALVVVFRGLAETSGLMAFAQGTDDFLTFVAAGFVLALASAIERGEVGMNPALEVELQSANCVLG